MLNYEEIWHEMQIHPEYPEGNNKRKINLSIHGRLKELVADC
jgi:hypothetical protein